MKSLTIQCITLCCCKASLARKRLKQKKRPVKGGARFCSYSIIVLVYCVFAIGAFASYTGGAVFGNSVTLIGTGASKVLTSTQVVIDSLVPTISTTFSAIGITVNASVDASTTVIDTSKLVSYGVTPSFTTLISDLNTIQTSVASLITAGANVNAAKTSLTTQLTTLTAAINTITTTITSWQSGIAVTGGSYVPPAVTVPAGVSTTSSTTDLGNAPDGATQMNSLNAMSLVAIIAALQLTINSLPSVVVSTVVTSNTPLKGNLNVALSSANTGITSSLSVMQATLDASFTAGQNTLSNFMTSVSTYNKYRNIAMIILSSFIFLIIIGTASSFYRKKPRAVKGCNLCVTPFYLLIQLLAVIMFILALIFGDVCSSVFDYTPAPILQGLDTATAASISQITTLRDQCSSNLSIVTIASNLNLVTANSVNITLQVDTQVALIDFSGISSFNLGPLVVMTPLPAQDYAQLTSLDTSALVATSLSALATDLNNLKTALNTLKTNVDGTSGGPFTASPNNAAVQAAAASDYATKITAMDSSINALTTTTSGTIDTMNAAVTSMSNLVTTLKTNADSAKVFF